MPEVFISYAHADDQPFVDGAAGWVTALADRLKKSLGMQRGGGRVTVWMDQRLEPQKQVDTALRERVARGDCFVAILSPRYLESPWCRLELESFLTRAGGAHERVFLVETTPTERGDWPDGIRNLSAMQFWAQTFEDPAPIPLGWPVANPTDLPYWRALNELSHFIGDRLQTVAAGGTADTQTIWIADPTDYVLDAWERLAGSLRQQGYRVLPASPGAYPSPSEADYRAALAADLAAADAHVQLLGPHPGRHPAWSPSSFTVIQAEAARTAAAARSRTLCSWRQPEVSLDTIADQAYRTLLTGAASGGLEDFQRHIVSRLAPRPAATPAPAAATAAGTLLPTTGAADAPGPLAICVSADAPDRALGERVRDILFGLGADANLAPEPAPNEPPSQWRQSYEAMLGDSHGVVIVYGSTPATWVQAQVQAARKLLARTRRGVWGALLDGPPGQQPDHGVRSHSLVMLDCRQGVAPEPLAQFLSSLRANTTEGPAHA